MSYTSEGQRTANLPCARKECGPYSTRLQTATATISPRLGQTEKGTFESVSALSHTTFSKASGSEEVAHSFLLEKCCA